MKIVPAIGFLFLLAACTTIEISEQDAFDNHETITPETFSYSQYSMKERTIQTEDGEEINSWFLEHQDAEATVVYFGGNGHLMVKSTPLINAYSGIPVNLVLFDYRGYGQSTGTPTVSGIQKDAEAVFKSAKEQFGGGRLFLHGQSMGSFLSAYIAERESVDGYILENPITDVERWTRTMIPWLLRPFIRFDIDDDIARQSNLETVASVDHPLLIFGGTEDSITSFKMAETLHEASISKQKELVIIEGGSHNDLPTYSRYFDGLIDFLIH